MNLEVITREPKGAKRSTPLLFIHGAYSSAHLWEPFFIPYFADQGYKALAVSLRGHGRSEGRDQIKQTRLRDYVNDVLSVVDGLASPPVLIGHSMGGMVVQKVIQHRLFPGVVLMASPPPHGIASSMFSAALFNPLMALQMGRMQTIGPEAATFEGAKRALFRDDTPDDYIRRVLPPAEPEPHKVMMDIMGADLPPSRPRRDIPVLVLGAGKDTCVTPSSAKATAWAFGTNAEIFPDMPHGMMLDPEWREVAKRILRFVVDECTAATTAV